MNLNQKIVKPFLSRNQLPFLVTLAIIAGIFQVARQHLSISFPCGEEAQARNEARERSGQVRLDDSEYYRAQQDFNATQGRLNECLLRNR